MFSSQVGIHSCHITTEGLTKAHLPFTPFLHGLQIDFEAKLRLNQLNYSYDKVEGELGGRGELGEEG